MKRLNIVIFVLLSTVTYSQDTVLNNFYQSDENENNYISIIIKEDSLNYYTTINQYTQDNTSKPEYRVIKNLRGTLVNKKNNDLTPVYFKGKLTNKEFITTHHTNIEVKVDEQKRWVWHLSTKEEDSGILQDTLIKQACKYSPTLVDYNIFLLLKKTNFSKIGNESQTFNVMSLYSEYSNDNYLKYVENEEIKVNEKKIQAKVILLLKHDDDLAYSIFWIDSKNNIIRYSPTAICGDNYTLIDKKNQ